MTKRADQLARSHTEQAIATLAAIMNNAASEDKDRIKAADSLLDRGHGKPLAAVIQLPPSKMQLQLLAAAGDDELLEIMRAKPLPRLGAPSQDAIDGEFTEVVKPVVLQSQLLATAAQSDEPTPDMEPAAAAEFDTGRDPLLD